MARSLRSLAPALVPLAGLALVTAAVVAVTASSGGDTSGGGAQGAVTEGGGGSGGRVGQVQLASFTTCDALLTYYRTNALKLVGPYGLGGGPVYPMGLAEDTTGGGRTRAVVPAPTAAPYAQGSNGAGTGTNVQVAGVDEGDLAKVVNGRMYSLTDGTAGRVLRVTALGGASPTVVASLKLDGWSPDQMLVAGDRLLLVGSGGGPLLASDTASSAGLVPGGGGALVTTRLAEVSISDPADPAIVSAVDVDGSVVGARLVDGVARLGITSSAGRLPFVYPGNDTDAARALALKTNQDMVKTSTLDDWLPRQVVRTVSASGKIGAAGTAERLVACGDVSAPRVFSGLDTLTLMTVDLARGGLRQWDSGAVVASGGTMYATAQHTYVATTPWQGWAVPLRTTAGMSAPPEEITTSIHLFSTTNDSPPAYVASGEVPGTLLGQYAMDEYDGVLRVASTTQPQFGGVSAPVEGDGTGGAASNPVTPTPQVSQSQVTTLRQRGDTLVTVGSVGGLGKNEQIHSVRFIDDVGYVVTYRQTDPLYTVDLSDPAAPRVAGELKILGFSAYLHPAGKGLLLGVGRDATAQGRTTGMQLSLFDVSDPANPRRLDQVSLDAAWSAVDSDPHAFTYVDGLALAPFETWKGSPAPVPTGKLIRPGPVPMQVHDGGVVAVRVQGKSLSQPTILRLTTAGPVRMDPNSDSAKLSLEAPLRTFVTGGVVYSLANSGVGAHDATTLKRLGYTAF